MSAVALAAPAAAIDASFVAPPTAAELAMQIPVPSTLPPRYDGEPIRHLSASSVNLLQACPESWRRRYLIGEKTAPSGSMFMGSRFDDTYSTFYEHQLNTNDILELDQLLDVFNDNWKAKLAEETDQLGVEWEPGLDENAGFTMTAQAVGLAYQQLVPRIGRPLSVQRKLEFKIDPQLDWTIVGYLDLETERDQILFFDRAGEVLKVDDQVVVQEHGEPEPIFDLPVEGPWFKSKRMKNPRPPEPFPAPASRLADRCTRRTVRGITDLKMKNSPFTAYRAKKDLQVSVYLAAKWLAGEPAFDFRFAQIAKPGERRQEMSTSIVRATRTEDELRATLVRFAQYAARIDAYYRFYGPDRPWPFADPYSWKCDDRFCEAKRTRSCPMAGL